MTDEAGKASRERMMRRWAGLACTAAFFLMGVAILPGLVSNEPVMPDPASYGLSSERASDRAEPTEQGSASSRGSQPESVEKSRSWSNETRAFDCMISPSEVVDIGSSIIGVIEEIAVDHSDYVHEGQVLAKLEASVEKAAVMVARARAERDIDVLASEASLALDEARQSRALTLFENDAVSLDVRQEVEAQATLAGLELQRAREDRRLAHLELERTRAALERRTIRSPVSGFVVERMMSEGEVIDEQTMLRLAQVDPLRIESILPASWFGRMLPGDGARIVPEAPLDEARVAEVASVDPVIDGASGTFSVHLLLANPDHDLPAGLRCQVSFLKDPDRRPRSDSSPRSASRMGLDPSSNSDLAEQPEVASASTR